MDIQTLFDTVVSHILSMNEPSGRNTTEGFECLYRGPDGTRCAVGVLIPDEEYSPDMEHSAVTQLSWACKNFTDEQISMLDDLQMAHDNDRNWDSTGFSKKDCLHSIAARYSLNWGFKE